MNKEKLEEIGVVEIDESLTQPYGGVAYYTEKGDYVGDEDHVKMLLKYGVKPEKSKPTHSVCSIGFSVREGAWYGWSHRAVAKFQVGDELKPGNVGVRSPHNPIWYPKPGKLETLEGCKLAAKAFADEVS